MSSRFRRPETERLAITNGDWLLVKKHLTAGEQRRMFRRMIQAETDKVDPLQVGLQKMATYLIDWSITDADDQPVDIRGLSEEQIAATLEMLMPEDFAEILNAVEAHENKMDAARDQEKKLRNGELKSSAILPSVESSDGDTNGSENLIAMSTAS